jgi:hypothetical protein
MSGYSELSHRRRRYGLKAWRILILIGVFTRTAEKHKGNRGAKTIEKTVIIA